MNDLFIFKCDENTDRPNIGYIKGSNKSVLIDCGGGPKGYKFILDNLDKNNLDYPNYIIITHHHWDHSFSIGYFNSISIGSKYTNDILKNIIKLNPCKVDDIISNDLEPLFCKKHLLLEYGNSFKDLKLKELDIITKDYKLDLGNRIIDIYEVVSPHTLGSLIVYDNLSKTLFIGDADCGYINDYDFIDDLDKFKIFISTIKKIDFKYIVRGHFKVMEREEYFKEMMEKYNDIF